MASWSEVEPPLLKHGEQGNPLVDNGDKVKTGFGVQNLDRKVRVTSLLHFILGGIAAAACLYSIGNTRPIAVDHSMALSWAEGVKAYCPNIRVQLPASNIVLLHCESGEKAAEIINEMEQGPLPGTQSKDA